MNTDVLLEVDSVEAWARLVVVLILSVLVGVGMWSVVVILPAIQADLGLSRASASLPYVFTMIGYGVGGVIFGKMADLKGIYPTAVVGVVLLVLGYALSSFSSGIFFLSVMHGLLIGIGTSSTFAPLIAHVSQWFESRKGAAVGVIASGQYLSGAIWPTLLDSFVEDFGWAGAYRIIAFIILVCALPLTFVLRKKVAYASYADSRPKVADNTAFVGSHVFTIVLMLAAFSCCVAMSMPQVHLVAFCSDLGFGAARGAKMLSVLLAFGVISRLGFGWLSDRLGGLKTLFLGVFLQGVGLVCFLFADTVASLYVVSAVFGLFQGGIVPAYALTVREHFPAKVAGEKVGLVMFASLAGMAAGGWIPGYLFDATGAYTAAFINGIIWNTVTLVIVGWLFYRLNQSAIIITSR